MASNWKDLVVQYHGVVGQASRIARTGRTPCVSILRESIDWSDLEHRLGEVHQRYVTGKIPQVSVSKKDQLTFQILLENLERSRSHLENAVELKDPAIDLALANLGNNMMILLDTGPHGPITGRPRTAEAGPHSPIIGRPETGPQTPTVPPAGGDEPDGDDEI